MQYNKSDYAIDVQTRFPPVCALREETRYEYEYGHGEQLDEVEDHVRGMTPSVYASQHVLRATRKIRTNFNYRSTRFA